MARVAYRGEGNLPYLIPFPEGKVRDTRQSRATYALNIIVYYVIMTLMDVSLVLNRTFYMPRAFPACREFHFSARIMQNAPRESRRACIQLRRTRVTVWYYEILLGNGQGRRCASRLGWVGTRRLYSFETREIIIIHRAFTRWIRLREIRFFFSFANKTYFSPLE